MKPNNTETVRNLRNWLGSGSINIFGMPFAGKDTLAHNLSKVFEGPVISGGDILRSHEDQGTIKKLMMTGELFPTDYYLSIILPFISQSDFDNKPLILSSLGRWQGEEPTIMKACYDSSHPIKAALHLNVDMEVIWERFEASQAQNDRAHRHDDAAHILEVRLEEYNQKTKPVIEFYKEQGLLVEVDGHGSIEETTSDAVKRLSLFMREAR